MQVGVVAVRGPSATTATMAMAMAVLLLPLAGGGGGDGDPGVPLMGAGREGGGVLGDGAAAAAEDRGHGVRGVALVAEQTEVALVEPKERLAHVAVQVLHAEREREPEVEEVRAARVVALVHLQDVPAFLVDDHLVRQHGPRERGTERRSEYSKYGRVK